jgi:hypothetical protein
MRLCGPETHSHSSSASRKRKYLGKQHGSVSTSSVTPRLKDYKSAILPPRLPVELHFVLISSSRCFSQNNSN